MLMHDGNDWPVGFLGAMYAGIVPVAVNTLLTVDDYAYMLENSRAQAALVSAALLPALRAAMAHGGHEVKTVDRLAPGRRRCPSARGRLDEFVAAHAPLAAPAATGTRRPGVLAVFVRLDRPAQGHLHTHANPYWTAELYGTPVLG